MGASATKPQSLSDNEKALLKVSWDKVMVDRADFSIELFFRIFQQLDDTQAMFAQLANKSLAGIKKDPMMKAHCIRIAAIVDTMLKELDDPVCLVEMFRNIARTHFRLGNKLGKSHYEVFGTIFMTLMAEKLGGGFDPATKAAWKKAYGGVQECLVNTKAQLEGS